MLFAPALLLAAWLACLPAQVPSVAVEDKYSCPHGWTRYGSKKCLKYVNELQDYERAQATCKQKNQGTLVTVHSHDEQNFVYSYIHSIAASSTPIWLGAKQIDFESILWLDKTENSYVNWAPSEPSHPDEICIAINPRTGMWHDVLCTEANVPACERAPTTQWPFFVAFCSEGWFQFNDEKCVRIISSQALNFYESQELCRSKYNSKLLSIKTNKESEFVHNLIKFRDIKLPVWLGAVQNDFSSFNWIDKSDVTFTNWAEGEPNDPDHACISIQASGGRWSDNDCKEQKLILCQKVVPEDGACETGWLQFRQDKCYRFVHVRLAFDDAEMLCNNLYSGHLPSIHSQEEQFMISQFLASVNVKNGSEIWLGARQMDFHNFNWGDGSLFNYSYWEQGEPSFPAEKCIEMSWRNGRWNDINCRLKRAVLCERQVASRHLIKPNLYQPTTCLSLDSNCSQSAVAATALPPGTTNSLLAAAAPVAIDQQQQSQPQSAELATAPTLEAGASGNISQSSEGGDANVSAEPAAHTGAFQQSTDDKPIKVISSIMSRSEAKLQAAIEQPLLAVNGSASSMLDSLTGSNGTSQPFIHYNLPPPERALSQHSPPTSDTRSQSADEDPLQGKIALLDKPVAQEGIVQSKSSPPAPIEQLVATKQTGEKANTNASSASLLDKIRPQTIETTTTTTTVGALSTLRPPTSGSHALNQPTSQQAGNNQQTAAAQEFAQSTVSKAASWPLAIGELQQSRENKQQTDISKQ